MIINSPRKITAHKRGFHGVSTRTIEWVPGREHLLINMLALAGRRRMGSSEQGQIFGQGVKLIVGNIPFRKGRHHSEAGADLDFNEKGGEQLVIERRAESTFPTRVALVAVFVEYDLAFLYIGIGRRNWSDHWFTATDRTTGRLRKQDCGEQGCPRDPIEY
jgi:hypothetical protein